MSDALGAVGHGGAFLPLRLVLLGVGLGGKEQEKHSGMLGGAAGLRLQPGPKQRELSSPPPTAVLGTLVETYVDAIRSGAVPCLESAVTALVELRNSAAVREAAVLYRELLEQRAELPMETEELLELHEQCQRETLQLFAERTITDDVERFRAELLVGAPRFGPRCSAAPCSALHPP